MRIAALDLLAVLAVLASGCARQEDDPQPVGGTPSPCELQGTCDEELNQEIEQIERKAERLQERIDAGLADLADCDRAQEVASELRDEDPATARRAERFYERHCT